jgi:hypothetical protein
MKRVTLPFGRRNRLIFFIFLYLQNSLSKHLTLKHLIVRPYFDISREFDNLQPIEHLNSWHSLDLFKELNTNPISLVFCLKNGVLTNQVDVVQLN